MLEKQPNLKRQSIVYNMQPSDTFPLLFEQELNEAVKMAQHTRVLCHQT